ncbi:MAG: pilus assembly FimT family protein [Candidatus Hodarchaeales archaeon]|jgi:Tfp pilus assembly protein FimT
MENESNEKADRIKQQVGVSLVELLLIIAIFTIFGATAYSFGANFLSRNHLKNKTNEIVSSLRVAQINSISGKEDSQWGVYVDSNSIIMFMGSFYVSPGTSQDQTYDVQGRVSISPDPVEVVFDKLNGNPNSTVTITVSNNIGGSNTISVNEVGVVDVN